MKDLTKFVLIFGLLFMIVGVKYYFFEHPSRHFFFLSNSDVMLKATEFLKRPTPIPYVENYVEYPVLIGVWGTALAYLSQSGTDFFFWNGLWLSFFATVNVFLGQDLAWRVFKQKIPAVKFLVPSTLFFTFYNWDSLAVFFLLLCLLLFYKGHGWLGSLFSIFGFWTKIFPIFSLTAWLVESLRRRRWGLFLATAALGLAVSLFLNLRFYLLSPRGLLSFFEFSRTRPPNIDSVWSSLYVVSDKVFGPGFYLKPFFNNGISWISLFLFAAIFLIYLGQKWHQRSFHLFWDTTFLVAALLLTAKVYSPQFNLWLVPLLIVGGLSFRKILLYDVLNLLVAWSVFQYFYEVYIKGAGLLPFPYFKLFTAFVFLRHLVLAGLVLDLWRGRRKYVEEKIG